MDEEKALITPETGLTAQQVQEHLEAGLGAGLPADSGRSEKEIILRHSLTFFNLVFIVLAVLLIVGKSTVMNMGFLGVVVINTVIGIIQEIRAKRAVERLKPAHLSVAVLPTADLTAHRWEAVTGGVMMEVWG